MQKYQALKNYLISAYGYEAFVIPFVVSWEGFVSDNMPKILKKLNINKFIMAYILTNVIKDTLEMVFGCNKLKEMDRWFEESEGDS